ncbi:fimbrial protein [Pseudomonas endophytica]|uniref:fimbrial protein n=1 Tax=Pseudomonas endophytica TaxID=1563157 RepID=UPI0009E8C2B9|nr:fimbrial protein [Pseudomonas endophytica]
MTLSRSLLTLTVLVTVGSAISEAQATCRKIYSGIQTRDNNTAQLTFGRINLTSAHLQPVGTPLGSVVISPASATGLTSETLMWECDLTDANDLYELFATNGDDRVGGFWDIGAADGLPNYFATWFPYVAVKLTHVNSGQVYTRYWQQARITEYDTVGTKIQIKAKHLSMIQAELVRVSSLPPSSGSVSNYCSGTAPTTGAGIYSYTCTQPNGYIQFQGGGIKSDSVGEDSSRNYRFWGARNGVGYGMRAAASISYTATCVARNVTPVVTFLPVTAAELNQGITRSSDFTIELECDNTVNSGTATNQTALGIQVAQSAYSQAQSMGLVTSGGAVTHLLSNGYGSDPSVATGVGISLRNATDGSAMNFLGWSNTGTGASSGWYPVLEGANNTGSNTQGYTSYSQTITATLGALPGLTANPGKVNATAYVLVKVQ